jgi:spoIIIJ-associated protein
MTSRKKDFFGKTVADAIKQACDSLQASQENLTIEVVGTGSSGIFGFIRKKAHIRVSLQKSVTDIESAVQAQEQVQSEVQAPKGTHKKVKASAPVEQVRPVPQEAVACVTPTPPLQETIPSDDLSKDKDLSTDEDEEDFPPVVASDEPLSAESLDVLQQELVRLLELMGLPSMVEIEAQGSSVRCHVNGDFQEDLTGQEGKILDSLQYLIRKIAAKKIAEKMRISIDVGGFREKRQDELQDQARELAALVKVDGKTQVIPSLNAAERRVVHMALQDDKEIRSRSVGDGLFKKVLIYKPGKPRAKGQNAENSNGAAVPGTGNTKKRSSSRGRRGKGNKPPTENEPTE